MFKDLLTLFLLSHIIGDFYWQSSTLAQNKQKSFIALLLHGLLYFLAFALCIVSFFSLTLLIVSGILAGLHLLVDIIKRSLTKKLKNKTTLYISDQLLHGLFIFLAAAFLFFQAYDHRLLIPINHFFDFAVITQFYTWLCLILLIIKPTNITIKQLLQEYRPDDDGSGIKNAGAFIGILERIIILLLLSIKQYSAMGLVLTAKSVARYNRIAEDKQFAEYYLLGTLLSTLFVIAGYLLLA